MKRRTRILLAAGVAAGCMIPVSTAGAQTIGAPVALPGVTVPIPVGVAAPQQVQRREVLDLFWWRAVTGHIGDCGPGSLPADHPGVIIGYGPGDMQSALFCPPYPWGNGSVNPS